MAGRREAISLTVLLLFACLYLLTATELENNTRFSGDMAKSAGSEDAASNSAPSTKDLATSLTDGGTKDPRSIMVTIENKKPRHTLTFLKWDSPIDPASLNSGVFKISDAISGEAIASPGIKVNRMLPPSRQDLVEIQPASSVSATMELKAPWIPVDGRKAEVQVEGKWRAVWPRAKALVHDEELHAMSSEDVLSGKYQSERILEMEL